MTRRATTTAAASFLLLPAALGAFAQPRAGDTGLDGLRASRDALIRAADFTAALDPALAIVEAMEETSDPQLGRELLVLGRIQAGLTNYEDAEDSYLRGIELIADVEGNDSPSLISANQGLGRAYLNERRFDEAVVALDEARAISRRVSGLFNVDQSTIIDDLTLAYLGTGDTIDALELQQERLANAMRRFEPDDARLIPFHAHLGDYLDNSRLRTAAREQYEHALSISESTFGGTSPQTLALLYRLAQIDLVLDQDNGIAARIETVLDVLTDLTAVERGRAVTALGDWALVYDTADAAAMHYLEAWRLFESSGEVDPAAYFLHPVPLNLVPPLSRVDRGTRRDPWAWGELTIEFDVSADGRAGNVRTAAIEPENEDIARDYIRRIRETFFRPRLADGVPVSTADVVYRQSFRYYVRD